MSHRKREGESITSDEDGSSEINVTNDHNGESSNNGHTSFYNIQEYTDEIEEEDLHDPRGADLFASGDEFDNGDEGVDTNRVNESHTFPLIASPIIATSTNATIIDTTNNMMDTIQSIPPLLPSTGELPTSSQAIPHSLPIVTSNRNVVPPLTVPPPSDDISYPGDYDWEGLDSALGLSHPEMARYPAQAFPGIGRNPPPPPPPPHHQNHNNPMLGEEATLTELETTGYSLAEIVAEQKFRRRIARDYQRFLTTFTDEAGQSIYAGRIRMMCAANGESLQVSYLHLVEANAFLAKLVANVPTTTLAIFDEATMRIVLRLFEEYDRIRPNIHVRITDLPTCDAIRDLRNGHLSTLIKVSGVVTRRSGVFPQLQLVKYDCGQCGAILGPFTQDLNQEIRLNNCSACGLRGPFTVNTQQTIYRNYQKLTLQESPGSVPAGRLPRHKDVILLYDLIDCARPGELIEVTGIYRNNFSYTLNSKHGFPVFATVIEANHISKRADEFAEFRLTEEDQREIRRLADDPHIGLRIIRSIAPSIYGHHDIKTAIALSLFGGQPKNVQGKHSIRGDINVLLLGDPGTAKSQFLKYVEKTAHRAVYATGQGASAVGLTASVRKDPVTREWTLEGGALVLADKGVCLIDEFDKMNDADRTSIHEAMEQQSISVSKAGIVASLQARCAIIAAANPIRGRYNAALPFGQNVNLTEPILSRFDVLCVVRDIVDAANDERLAKFVVGSHVRSHPTVNTENWELADTLQAQTLINNVEPLPQNLLKKYILYAKGRIYPELGQVDVDKISRLYVDLRRESLATGSIPITVRHVESMVRMAEAHARMHLRDTVRSDDIDLAIRVMLESFVSSQKFSVMQHLKRSFSKYIIHRKEHGELLTFTLNDLLQERLRFLMARFGSEWRGGVVEIQLNDFEARARELNIYDLKPYLTSRAFIALGCRIDTARRVIIYESKG